MTTAPGPDPVDGAGGRLDRLERRLDVAESRLAIMDLKARYAALVDARFAHGSTVDGDVLVDLARRAADLFCADGEWDGGPGLGVARGRREIAGRLATPTIVFARHFFVTPRIEVDGDTATGRWELLSPFTRPDGTAMWMAGTEDDTYRRVDGVWLQASMALTTYFVAPAGDGWPRILA